MAPDGGLCHTASMESWTIFESFDSRSGRLYLDVVDSSGKPPAHDALTARPLESFPDFSEAHAFLDGYVQALEHGVEKPVREVFCGKHEHPGCDVGPCVLGVTSAYRCASRDRDKPL